jgi:hypothetical protein
LAAAKPAKIYLGSRQADLGSCQDISWQPPSLPRYILAAAKLILAAAKPAKPAKIYLGSRQACLPRYILAAAKLILAAAAYSNPGLTEQTRRNARQFRNLHVDKLCLFLFGVLFLLLCLLTPIRDLLKNKTERSPIYKLTYGQALPFGSFGVMCFLLCLLIPTRNLPNKQNGMPANLKINMWVNVPIF